MDGHYQRRRSEQCSIGVYMMLVLALLAGFSMNLATIMMHVTSVSLVLPHVRSYAVARGLRSRRFGPNAVIGISIAGLLALQLISAGAWGVLYLLLHLASGFGAAFYLALTTISALGGDDAAVHSQWRVLLPMSSINGALLFGLSTAVMFRLVTMFHIADDFPRVDAGKLSGVDSTDRGALADPNEPGGANVRGHAGQTIPPVVEAAL